MPHLPQRIGYILGFLIGLLPIGAFGQVQLTDETTRYSIGKQVAVLEDQTHTLRTLPDVRRPEVARRFVLSQQETINRGFSTADYWVRFDLENRSRTNQPWLMEMGSGNFWAIDLYVIETQTGRVLRRQGGERLGRRSREIDYNTFIFTLPIQPGKKYRVYMRLAPLYGQALFPLYIWQERVFLQSAQRTGFLWGGYYGFFLAVLLYHLMMYGFNRDRNHLLLGLYLVSYLFYELSRVYCLGVRYIWPGNDWFIQHALSTSFCLALVTFLWFYSSVLKLKQVAPGLRLILNGISGVIGLSWLVTLLELPGVSVNAIITILGVLTGTFVIFLGAYCWYRGDRTARYYSAAALVLYLGGLIHSLNRAGVIQGSDLFVHYTLNLGSVLELIFLTIGLADTVRNDRRERNKQQQAELEAAELRGLAEERERMMGELHDSVGSSLLTLRQSVQQIRTQPPLPTTLENLEQLIQATYNEVHQIVNNLLPVEFEKKGLSLALQELLAKLNRTGKPHFFLLLSGQEDRLKQVAQYQLYLILVELINNAIKHAQATEIGIRFASDANTLTVTVQDNGIGMSANQVREVGLGRGWRNIRKRLALIDGHLQAEPEEGIGLTIRLLISFA